MVRLLVVLVFCALGTYAQTELRFDQKIIDCEDRWIALPTENGYAYGFVYLDNSAGMTLFLMGTFKVNQDNIFIPNEAGKKRIRVLINTRNIALIPKEKYGELHIEEVPSWLAFFRTPNNNVDRLFRLGHVYNKWKEGKEALKCLNAVRKIDNKYPGLDAEYYLVFRQLGNYGRAEVYGEDAREEIQKNPCQFNKTQVFNFTAASEMDNAERAYLIALRTCTDETLKAELAYNIAFQYFKLKDKMKFKHWENEINRWIIPKDIYSGKMRMMASRL